MEFYLEEEIDNKRVAITYVDTEQGGVVTQGTTKNHYRCPLFQLVKGRIVRFTLSKKFIKESGILTDNYNKIVID